jgi:hypothetical protein
LPGRQLADVLPGVGPFSLDTFEQSTVDFAMQVLGSLDNLAAVSAEFFTGTHQRVPTVSRFRFDRQLQLLKASPRADFATLCLAILLIQQYPSGKAAVMQSPLYIAVKNLINLLEAAGPASLDLVQSKVLVTFYEMGHGLHTAAYISISSCARAARAINLHKKTWRYIKPGADRLALEEQKRTWWAIHNMERSINLCNGDPLFVTEDAERADPLPIEDLMWSEASDPGNLDALIASPPALDTPFNITVGQMARECQISHLAGRVVRHVFDPTSDPTFNAEESAQLDRTLNSYLPLLADEELRIGKYCGALSVCNRFVWATIFPTPWIEKWSPTY